MASPAPDPEAVRLIAGPYSAPALRKGDRAHCHLSGGTVVITAISDGRIPWPRCRALDHRGGSGLLMDDELLRALRTEARVAVSYWWGVSRVRVGAWRRALGVERFNPGSARLQRRNIALAADAIRGVPLPAAAVAERRTRAVALGLIRHTRGRRWPDRPWTPEEVALLGTMPDGAVATRVRRSRPIVQRQRVALGIPAHGRQGRRPKAGA